MVEHLIWDEGVVGSSPIIPICRITPVFVFGQILSLQGVVISLEAPPLSTCGEIGRHARLKILFERVWVRLPSGAFRLSNL